MFWGLTLFYFIINFFFLFQNILFFYLNFTIFVSESICVLIYLIILHIIKNYITAMFGKT